MGGGVTKQSAVLAHNLSVNGNCHLDDIFIHAANQATHDNIARQVLWKLSDGGMTPSEKRQFSKETIKVLDHITDGNGIRPDPEKIAAIYNCPPSTTIAVS